MYRGSNSPHRLTAKVRMENTSTTGTHPIVRGRHRQCWWMRSITRTMRFTRGGWWGNPGYNQWFFGCQCPSANVSNSRHPSVRSSGAPPLPSASSSLSAFWRQSGVTWSPGVARNKKRSNGLSLISAACSMADHWPKTDRNIHVRVARCCGRECQGYAVTCVLIKYF